MKAKNTFLLFFLFVIITIGFAQEKTKKQLREESRIEKTKKQLREESRIEKQKETEVLVNSKAFIFVAKNASSLGFSYVDLTTNPNYIKFQPDFIKSKMPFFGMAYSGVGYDDKGGLYFEGKPQEFTVEKKKKKYEIKTVVEGDTDSFMIFLTVFSEGSATLSITSNNRSAIFYNGNIFKIENKK